MEQLEPRCKSCDEKVIPGETPYPEICSSCLIIGDNPCLGGCGKRLDRIFYPYFCGSCVEKFISRKEKLSKQNN